METILLMRVSKSLPFIFGNKKPAVKRLLHRSLYINMELLIKYPSKKNKENVYSKIAQDLRAVYDSFRWYPLIFEDFWWQLKSPFDLWKNFLHFCSRVFLSSHVQSYISCVRRVCEPEWVPFRNLRVGTQIFYSHGAPHSGRLCLPDLYSEFCRILHTGRWWFFWQRFFWRGRHFCNCRRILCKIPIFAFEESSLISPNRILMSFIGF